MASKVDGEQTTGERDGLPAGWGWRPYYSGGMALCPDSDVTILGKIAVAHQDGMWFSSTDWHGAPVWQHATPRPGETLLTATPRPGETLLAAAQREAEAALWACDGFGVGEVRGVALPASHREVSVGGTPIALPGLPGLWRVTDADCRDGATVVDARKVVTDCPRALPCVTVGSHTADECTPEPATPKSEGGLTGASDVPAPVEGETLASYCTRHHLAGARKPEAQSIVWLSGEWMRQDGTVAGRYAVDVGTGGDGGLVWVEGAPPGPPTKPWRKMSDAEQVRATKARARELGFVIHDPRDDCREAATAPRATPPSESRAQSPRLAHAGPPPVESPSWYGSAPVATGDELARVIAEGQEKIADRDCEAEMLRARISDLEAELADLSTRHRDTVAALYQAAPDVASALGKSQVEALSVDRRYGVEVGDRLRAELTKKLGGKVAPTGASQIDDTAEIVDDVGDIGCSACDQGPPRQRLIITGSAGCAPLCIACYTRAVREDERRRAPTGASVAGVLARIERDRDDARKKSDALLLDDPEGDRQAAAASAFNLAADLIRSTLAPSPVDAVMAEVVAMLPRLRDERGGPGTAEDARKDIARELAEAPVGRFGFTVIAGLAIQGVLACDAAAKGGA